jgi:hypothetical protein
MGSCLQAQLTKFGFRQQGSPTTSPYVSDGLIALCCKRFRVHHVIDILYYSALQTLLWVVPCGESWWSTAEAEHGQGDKSIGTAESVARRLSAPRWLL